ncbi:MAG: protein-L-isoaspartate(D-aspartate) O-methyltransferase [Saprospiraceae bacterium]|nr:protein-L-isoaspartate(D-aspartate) O-methyltransferase [Saprospiraceae bacterium]
MVDTHRHRGLRQQLVQELKFKGIKDDRILNAFMQIPRHYFLEKTFAEWAYKDVAFPIDADQTISQPYTVAIQTSLLDIKQGDKVLEIGTGSGFQACVLNFIGAKVYTIERQKTLYDKTEKFLHQIGFGTVRTLFGDGYEGSPRFAPFDKILVTAGATEIPVKLIDQLKPNGVMVIPLGEGNTQKMLKITKNENGGLERENFGDFSFVPFLKGVNNFVNTSKQIHQTL